MSISLTNLTGSGIQLQFQPNIKLLAYKQTKPRLIQLSGSSGS